MLDVVPVLAISGFEAVATAFGSPRTEQTVIHLAYVFGLLLLLLGIALAAKLAQRIKAEDPKARHKRNLEILHQALRNRSRMDVCFHPHEASKIIVPCALEDLHNTHGRLDLPGQVTPSQSWVNKSFLCFFRIPGPKGRPFFYKFTTKIIALHKHNDRHHLDFALPDQIELGQKRRHLRLKIPRNDILDFRIWAGDDDHEPPGLLNTDSKPVPLAIFSPDRATEFYVVDLSGGGICLEYDPRRLPGLDDYLQNSQALYMRLELTNIDEKLPSTYYMAARLRTRQENFDTGTFQIGYEFVQYAQDQPEGGLKWINVRPELGIADLITWVFKRHLELYREQESN